MKRYAIIGLAGMYPDANTPHHLFNNLLQGLNSIRRFSADELKQAGTPDSALDSPRYRPFGTTLTGADKFDAELFNMNPHEAAITDPQQRIFLSCAYQALQDAGYDPLNVKGRVGVFGAISENMYMREVVMRSEFYSPFGLDHFLSIGNSPDFLSTRVSYKLNLNGPSLTVLSACSGSLVALNSAIRSLDAGECDSAIVGGVSLWLPQPSGYMSVQGSPFSPSGLVSPFDDNADGMVRGSGCSIVVVKRLADAEADRDHIYGVVEGIGINNDGRRKVGLAAPSVEGQVDAMTAALANAQVESTAISYIEAHGTGTRLGDPIELRSLGRAYSRAPNSETIRVGSIKANIGHLDAAAGLTGLVKILLMMKHQVIPQQINYQTPNRNFDFEANGISVSDSNVPLCPGPKFMGLNGLGIGGTNVHVIVSGGEAPAPQREDLAGTFVFPFSASTSSYLLQQCKSLAEHLDSVNSPLSDISYTLFQRLTQGEHRTYFMAKNIEDLRRQLTDYTHGAPALRPTSEVAERWVNSGIKEDFSGSVCDGYRISLPPIQFLGERHWIDVAPQEASPKNSEATQADSTLDGILAIWSRHIGRDICPDESFGEIGGESMDAVMIADQISCDFSYDLNINVFDDNLTPRQLAHLMSVEANGPTPLANDLVRLQSGSSPIDVYLIHPAGGSIFPYRRLIKGVETRANIYAIGFPQSVKLDTSIEDLAAIYARMIADTCGDHRVVLGGYSFGGNEALAVASELQGLDITVRDVLMIDSIVPESYLEAKLTDEEYLAKLPEILSFALGDGRWIAARTVCQHTSIEQAIEAARADGIVPQELSNPRAKRIYETWVSNHRVLARQDLDNDLDVHITLLYASQQLPEDLYSFTRMLPFHPEQWKKYCTSLSTVEITGNHYSIFSDNTLLNGLRNEVQLALHSIEESTLLTNPI